MSNVTDITQAIEQRTVTNLEMERARIWAKLCDVDDAIDTLESKRFELLNQLAELDCQIAEVV